ncbi:MAG: hypothetical protein QOI20_3234, partial [Acidimicrobiaceae bacterium]|nr:hypothetical protein [Acidimicrobiaceae bacterium]
MARLVSFGDERLPSRFWDKCAPEPMSGCWLFVGCWNGMGYGSIFVADRAIGAHRYAYETLVGELASSLDLDHLCRIHCCVNPAHLEPVAHRTNVLRGIGPTAAHAAQTHCKRGHVLTPDNVMPSSARKGHRACLVCDREKKARNAASHPGPWPSSK